MSSAEFRVIEYNYCKECNEKDTLTKEEKE